ncbi:unnamed protein product [Paramecium sonneborni]|uniref:Transmembrane protein n=1 Tax=Paramecium sonneborni TaxID=65129 RepID=A0A8S1RAV4_9CILI|nr:unnamed protein product [Paramecium sonneborni]
MKIITLLSVLFVIGSNQRLPIGSSECSIYLAKFGTANNVDGSGATKLAFSGDVQFENGIDVKVSLRYSDVDLFSNLTYYGFVKEDGKPQESTCLDLKLYKYTSNSYSDAIEIKNFAITSSNSTQKQWRYYHFTIPGTQLNTSLVFTQNSNQFLYKGYYAIAYYAANTDQLQYTFYFEFSMIINREGEGFTAFKPLSRKATSTCDPNKECVTQDDTILKWCKDFSCTNYETPDLHYNDTFVIQQIFYSGDMTVYYLTETEVWFVGDGLLQQATKLTLNNTTPGQVIIQLQAEVAWNNVSIQVSSILSSTQSGQRRLLTQTSFDTFSGKTSILTCIKAQDQKICPSCEQECEINGFAHDGCPECQSFLQINEFILLAILLAFTI